jgi:hypothetical protein
MIKKTILIEWTSLIFATTACKSAVVVINAENETIARQKKM